jgi:hypothetical protein
MDRDIADVDVALQPFSAEPPSLEILVKEKEFYNLGNIPDETCSLVKQLEEDNFKLWSGCDMVEHAKLNIRASCKVRRALLAWITGRRKCNAEDFNMMFELAMKYGKCMDGSKRAMIELDSACSDVLECSTIGFMYAIEGHQSRAMKKFTSAGKKADGMTKSFDRMEKEMNDLSEEVQRRRSDLLLRCSSTSEEEKKEAKPRKGHFSPLFGGSSTKEEEVNTNDFTEGIYDAVDALKRLEGGLAGQVSFWMSVCKRYKDFVDKLKDLKSENDLFSELLSLRSFKYEALVTHCW